MNNQGLCSSFAFRIESAPRPALRTARFVVEVSERDNVRVNVSGETHSGVQMNSFNSRPTSIPAIITGFLSHTFRCPRDDSSVGSPQNPGSNGLCVCIRLSLGIFERSFGRLWGFCINVRKDLISLMAHSKDRRCHGPQPGT